ncbi:hypothetical protein Tco_0772901, partial [Tanacetum coccineum]
IDEEPMFGLIYDNEKTEKRFMATEDIKNFSTCTLERVSSRIRHKLGDNNFDKIELKLTHEEPTLPLLAVSGSYGDLTRDGSVDGSLSGVLNLELQNPFSPTKVTGGGSDRRYHAYVAADRDTTVSRRHLLLHNSGGRRAQNANAYKGVAWNTNLQAMTSMRVVPSR